MSAEKKIKTNIQNLTLNWSFDALSKWHDPHTDLNSRWKILSRKIKTEVKESPDRYSLLYLPYPVIVPGGRFREIYYWDSFWIIRGLIQCEMLSTAKGKCQIFFFLVSWTFYRFLNFFYWSKFHLPYQNLIYVFFQSIFCVPNQKMISFT